MTSRAADAVGGFNSYLKELRVAPNGKRVTLLQFDNKFEYTYEKASVQECTDLVNGDTYKPRGNTALLDAIGLGMDKLNNKKRVLVVIYTDGEENASKQFSAEQIKTKIAEAKTRGWEVVFMASEPKAVYYARGAMGMSLDRTAFVDNAYLGTANNNFNALRSYTEAYASSADMSSFNLQTAVDNHVKGADEANKPSS
jgi:hypothetical protein